MMSIIERPDYSRWPSPSPLDDLDLDYEDIISHLESATDLQRQAVMTGLHVIEPFLSPLRFAMKADQDILDPPHLRYLDKKLVELVTGKLPGGKTKLMVTMPPRHGKSELCSKFLPAWYLSRYPDRRVILTSYEAEFAAEWGGKARDVLNENLEWAGIEIKSDSKAKHRWNVAGRKGGMQTAGARGAVTGKGAHLFIIDDPVKNSEDAQSEAKRQGNWDWYVSTAKTRLEPGAAELLVMTRWNEDDLGGRLLATQSEKWEIVNFPALAEEHDVLGRGPGDALWPGAYDVKALEEIRDTPETGMWWSALYQQRPTPEEGGMFARSDFRHWEFTGDGKAYILDGEVIPVDQTIRFQTVDLAASTKTRADYTVVCTWAVTRTEPAHLLLLDRFRGRVEAPEHLTLIAREHDRWTLKKPKVRFTGVEKVTFGMSVLQEAARHGYHWLRPLEADSDKYSRAIPAAQLVKAHKAWFPRRCTWLEEWENELLQFPHGTHDDQVDCFAYAGVEFGKRRRWAPPQRKEDDDTFQKKIDRQLRSRQSKAQYHPILGKNW